MVKGRLRQARSHDHQMLRFQPVEDFKRRMHVCVCVYVRGDSESHPRNDIGQREKEGSVLKGWGVTAPGTYLIFMMSLHCFSSLYFFLRFSARMQTRAWFRTNPELVLASVCEVKQGFWCVWRNEKMYCDGKRKVGGGARSGRAR
ncbi:hypothetical protein LZ32DRAFT_151764 [Colletotrichum eremochloae]|nr:hypothetical protein LZ32DRAFT_151764 [Colletotrichum eremochloae]